MTNLKCMPLKLKRILITNLVNLPKQSHQIHHPLVVCSWQLSNAFSTLKEGFLSLHHISFLQEYSTVLNLHSSLIYKTHLWPKLIMSRLTCSGLKQLLENRSCQ